MARVKHLTHEKWILQWLFHQVEINVFECNKFWKEICGKGQLPVHYPTRRNLNTVSNTTFFLRALAERIRILRLGIIFHWLNGHDMLSSMGREELTWWNRSIRIRSRQNKGPKVFGGFIYGPDLHLNFRRNVFKAVICRSSKEQVQKLR